MKSKYVISLLVLSVFITIGLLSDKNTVLKFLMVDGDEFSSPDLIVLLEGGSLNFAPTQERVNKAIELYKQHRAAILICAYRQFKNDIKKHMISRGVKAEDFMDSEYDYRGKEGGGTYNNVLEIISILKINEIIKNTIIVTSPYHEMRVSIIYSRLIKKADMGRLIYIGYANIENSEASYTDTPRFIEIISHEVFGVSGFYIKEFQGEFLKLFP